MTAVVDDKRRACVKCGMGIDGHPGLHVCQSSAPQYPDSMRFEVGELQFVSKIKSRTFMRTYFLGDGKILVEVRKMVSCQVFPDGTHVLTGDNKTTRVHVRPIWAWALEDDDTDAPDEKGLK